MADPYFGILGLGFAGFAVLDGVPLLMLPSNATAQDNLLRSSGAVSNIIARAIGETIARDRRSLNINITTPLTSATAALMGTTTFQWWSAGLNGRSHTLRISPSTGDSFLTNEAFVQSVNLTVGENQLSTLSFSITAYRFEKIAGGSIPRQQTIINPSTPYNQPLPYWACLISSPAIGTPLGFTMALNNNYQFNQLLESTVRPPTPRMVSPGPFSCEINVTTLAPPGADPLERGSIDIQLGTGGTVAQFTPPVTRIRIPYVYREPQFTYQGMGGPNDPIKLQVGYKALGDSPYFA